MKICNTLRVNKRTNQETICNILDVGMVLKRFTKNKVKENTRT